MNWNFIGKILFFFGLLILIHCTYSAIQCIFFSNFFFFLKFFLDKTFLKIIDKEYKNLPKDVEILLLYFLIVNVFL